MPDTPIDTPPLDAPPALSAADAAARAALARAAAGDLLGPTDIQAIWRIGKTQFWRLDKAKMFDHLKVDPPVGPRCFSGARVHRYVTAAPAEPTWGRKTFGSGRRA